MLARLTNEAVLARVFAGFEAILTLGVTLGGPLAPLVIEVLGRRPALVVVGLLAPAAVAARWPALRRLDGRLRIRDADIEILRAAPMLSVVPAATATIRASVDGTLRTHRPPRSFSRALPGMRVVSRSSRCGRSARPTGYGDAGRFAYGA